MINVLSPATKLSPEKYSMKLRIENVTAGAADLQLKKRRRPSSWVCIINVSITLLEDYFVAI